MSKRSNRSDRFVDPADVTEAGAIVEQLCDEYPEIRSQFERRARAMLVENEKADPIDKKEVDGQSRALRRWYTRRAHAPPDPDAYSIEQFCLAHGISESFFYKLQTLGLGPRVMKIGGRTLISREAAAAWRAEREAATANT